MEKGTGVDTLFFELASESRLGMLKVLRSENLKMQEIARRLDLTATEASRQLERMSAALLVQRRSDGTYAVTPYGHLELRLSSSMEFVFKHREYFLTHDLAEVPTKFVDRLGELSKGELKMGLVESMMRTSSIIGAAERFMWAVSPEQLPQPLDSISRQVPKGVEYRIISPDPPAKMGMLENRTLHSCPVVLALTEKEASVLFRLPDGRVDHAGFIGSDPEFLGWARDVFLHYWEYASARK